MNICYIIFGDLITDIDIHQSISHFNLRYSLYCVVWFSIIKNFNYSSSFMNMVCYGTIHSILEIFIPKVMPVLPYIVTCVTGHILSIICILFINKSKECIEKNDKIIDFLSLRVVYIGITYILFIPFLMMKSNKCIYEFSLIYNIGYIFGIAIMMKIKWYGLYCITLPVFIVLVKLNILKCINTAVIMNIHFNPIKELMYISFNKSNRMYLKIGFDILQHTLIKWVIDVGYVKVSNPLILLISIPLIYCIYKKLINDINEYNILCIENDINNKNDIMIV